MFAVLALDVVCDEFALDHFLVGDAAKFLPHVSVLPRLRADQQEIVALRATVWEWELPELIELRGPKSMGRTLEWYECEPETQGFKRLAAIHSKLLASVPRLIS